jgi:predicted membrane channel-forming protein YqfA (hemolysin III family)
MNEQDDIQARIHHLNPKNQNKSGPKIDPEAWSFLEALKEQGGLQNGNAHRQANTAPASVTHRLFALGVMLTAIFLLILSLVLPDEDRSWWAGWAAFIFVVGTWQFDRARRKSTPAREEKRHTDKKS